MLHADLLGWREHRFGAAEVDDDLARFESQDDAREDVALLAGVLVEDDFSLGLAQALQHDLLGGLRGDAAGDADRVVLGQRLTDLDVGFDLDGGFVLDL